MSKLETTRETVAVGRLTITSPRQRDAAQACFVKSAVCFVRAR